MTAFYWVMSILIVGTLLPSALFMLMYAFSGDNLYARRAGSLWALTRAFALFGFNILVWGHVIVGLWQIWFR